MTLIEERGTSVARHPWFASPLAPAPIELLQRYYGNELERHEQVTQNFGRLRGWLRVVFWTVNGDSIGVTASEWLEVAP